MKLVQRAILASTQRPEPSKILFKKLFEFVRYETYSSPNI